MNRFNAAVCIALLGASPPAGAVCPETVVENALSARVRGDQADALIREAVELLPDAIELDPIVFACPAVCDGVGLRNTNVALDLQQTEVWLEANTIAVRAVFDVDVETNVDVEFWALPDASCPATLAGESLEVLARVGLNVVQCEPDVVIQQLDVNLSPENTELALGNCGLYDDVANALYGWFEGRLIDYVKELIVETVPALAPEMLQETLDGVATEGVEALGFKIFVAPQAIDVTNQEIALTLGAGVTSVLPPERCSPGGIAAIPSAGTTPIPTTSGGASLAVSRHFANYLVDVAWRQGWLCVDTRDFGLNLGAVLEDLAPGVEVNAVVFAPIRPSLLLGENPGGSELGVEIPSLEVQVGIELPNTMPSLITIEGNAFATAALTQDPVDGGLLLTPIALDTSRLDVLTESGPLVLDPDGLRGTIDTLVMPLFREQLAPLALTGGVFSAAGVVAELTELTSDSESIGVSFELYGAADFDNTAPETRLESEPPQTVGSSMTLTMASLDDAPPTRFVSHWVTINGIREPEPRTGRVLAFTDLRAGEQTLEIAAMDLAGNVDPSPLSITLEVDAQPPILEIIDAPRGLARNSTLRIEHDVRDDRTATADIRMDYTIGEIAAQNEPDLVVARGSLRPDEILVLEGLREDQAYRVTLAATDRAGNVTERVLSFAVDQDPTLDCSSTGSATVWLALLSLCLVLVRRRSLASVYLVAVVSFAFEAQAITTGGAFAGPTLESGTSAYWNAASLTQKRGGTRFYFEGGGSLIDIDYQRTGAGLDVGQSYENVNFGTISPSFSFMLTTQTPLPYLDLMVGGFSPTTSGASWPSDGPQRFFGTDQTLFTYSVPVGVLLSPSNTWGVSFMVGPSWGFVDTYNAFDFGNFANDQLPPGAEPFPTESELLEGVTYIDASGFGYSMTAGVWASPLPDLRIGIGGIYNSSVTMNGQVELRVPSSVEESTGLALTPVGDIELLYVLPWALNGEVEYRVARHRLAVTFDFQQKARQDVTVANVTNGDPSFVDGPRLSVKAAVGDWTLGVRDLWRVSADWEVALRFDYDPRSIPDESLNPVNLDFTSYEAAIGGRYRVGETISLSMTYAFRYLEPVTITNSLFNPRLPGDSGLNLPSANGVYDPDPVHRFVLGVDWGG